MLKRLTKLLLALLLTASMSSCITSRRVNYLQDMTQGSQIELENKFEAVIAPYDELSINVTCSKPELATPFASASGGLLVDLNGDMDFPVLGRIHTAGLTRLRLQDTLNHMLMHQGLIDDPHVIVRFKSFKIFFLGGTGGKVISIPNERCTFLEALAMAGDLSPFIRRDHIAVMREVDGVMTMRYLDPRSSDIFNDPYFMLQQNDFIITQSMDASTYRSEASYWLGIFSTAVSFTSLLATLLVYRAVNK